MAPQLGYEPVDATDVPPPREIEVSVPGGISATIAVPHGVDSDDPRWATPTKRMVLILHGQMGHRDYCYQKILAHKLAAYRGMYSLRIDFRGCGASDDCADPKVGRVVESDLEDITRCMEFITNASLNPLGVSFVPSAIVAHSRGAVVMYLWALQQEALLKNGDPERKAFNVPNLVSCSTRYNSLTMFEKEDIIDDDFEFLEMRCLRHGKVQLVEVPRHELNSLIDADLTCVKDLPANWSVLSVYGMEDEVVSANDGAQFSNLLSRCRYSHHLELIENADHMFMGIHHIDSEEDQEDYNPQGWPVAPNKLVNYRHHAAAAILHWLKPENESLRFLYANASIQSVPRWKSADGLYNFRDIGGWQLIRPTFSKSSKVGSSISVRSNYIYRSSGINSITGGGADTLGKMGVKTVFDLRSPQEAAGDLDPGYLTHAGIKVIKSPIFDLESVAPEKLAKTLVSSSQSKNKSEHIYKEILREGIPSLRTIFTYIKDHPLEPLLLSCSNGQDLTGVVIMLILSLCGVEKHVIAHEQGLSVIGTHMRRQVAQNKSVERVFTNSSSVNEENIAVSMFRTLDTLEENYGGIKGYMGVQLGFDESEVKAIYNNLVTPQAKGQISFPVSKI
ncbi:hypothetical protein CA3LBN_001582 [Candidozyma haemuli]|uniref:Tyrosine specific protein phosphatases domain-containing protein n=1 Tax=Candidozyma haemuli TaxID=45357 RepID=A0ABX8I2L9_9ASCO|nr:hypothetical protein CA3LBN_001582 [[Candida] haemuloni]